METDIIFEPLKFRNLTVKNRIFRSSISGRWDNYDGSGTQARINWEEKFARGGVGAIITSFVPVAIRGRIMPNYATIDCDERIPFWQKVGEKVHEYDCKLILQLSHSGRQQDIAGVENQNLKALSSTNKTEPLHGFRCQAMTLEEIKDTIQLFADGARRVREAGLDGIELHSANGYLFTQFLSSGINDRQDEYGGSLENRARFLLDVIRAIRKEVGNDFHLQFKISAIDYNNAVTFWEKPGNTLADSIQICQWAQEAGVDAVHVSTGSLFPHPLNPIGDFRFEIIRKTYDTMLSSGIYTFRNYLLFRYWLLRPIFAFLWNRVKKDLPPQPFSGNEVKDEEMRKLLEANQGINLVVSREIKKHVNIPVLCTGGFQQASYIRKAINEAYCDGVTIARPLVANNNLVHDFAAGKDLPDKPCTYCNKCLLNVMENPFGCYELSRFDGDYEEMMREVMSVFHPTHLEQQESSKTSVPLG
ncbi:NADH:flavin oxidoreductase/NADH oxidase [Scytonema sp. HK-05]|uniref:NADH:flavin oxidoreductase n=1 Tax=Scytonema sp. HK-05 TaxID=1137095 RepID=UPI000935C0B3|nr:NADH:flavin oxidoreductase [Scytonema sp. HK-05]OKH58426.1 FMN reductase [Scytonema sp. HK-05]BAY49319.1 NADH:flavin oxidoreductase/NADH oxidase [Scytonema sp. HK-05]